VKLNEKRFGFEPEVTIKVARMGCSVYELGISYNGRTYEEGKKIGLKDAFRALYCIIRYGLFSGSTPKPELAPLPKAYRDLADQLERAGGDQWEAIFEQGLYAARTKGLLERIDKHVGGERN